MSRSLYQYETSPRKIEPEYEPVRKKSTNKKRNISTQKRTVKTKYQLQREKKKVERKNHAKQILIVLSLFGMLLAVSYREIHIMEMFNNKKDMENQLALIEKENGQIEKDIKAEESKLDWNIIRQKAKDELGMKEANKITVELERTDNVEKEEKLIKEDNTSLLEKIVEKIIK